MLCRTLAEMYCLQATKTISSGANIPVRAHLTLSSHHRFLEKLGGGRFRCNAVQTQRPMVRTQLVIKENVPRPSGSDTQLTVDESRSRLAKSISKVRLTDAERKFQRGQQDRIVVRLLKDVMFQDAYYPCSSCLKTLDAQGG